MSNAIGMQIMNLAFICALGVATLAPAPARNEDRLLLSLLGTVFLAIVVMGVLALLDVLTGTAILAAIGASIMVPCAWLARAPGASFEDAEDDDGGGSPPYEPSPRDGPDDRRPEPTPAPALSFAMSPQAPARDPVRLRSRPRRADHRSIAHRRAAGRHEGRRRRGVMRLRLSHGWRRRRRLRCVGDAERGHVVA